MSRQTFVKTSLFVFLLLCLAFIFLTATRNGPFGKALFFSTVGLIVCSVWIILCPLMARQLSRIAFYSRHIHIRYGLPVLVFGFALGCAWTWIQDQPFRIDRVSLPGQERVHIIQDDSGTNVLNDHFSSVSINIRGNIKTVLELIKRSLLNLHVVLILSPLLLLYAAYTAGFAGWLFRKKRMAVPYSRKLFHFLIFTVAAVLQILFGFQAVTLFGFWVAVCVVYACYRGKGFSFYDALARPRDEPHATFFILVPLFATAAGGLVSNLFFAQFSPIGYLVAGWGDAIGEPVGARWGRHRYTVPTLDRVPAERSFEGSAAVFFFGMVVVLIATLLMGFSMIHSLRLAFFCGLVGAIVEGFSNHGIDNMTIQVAVSGTAYFLMMT